MKTLYDYYVRSVEKNRNHIFGVNHLSLGVVQQITYNEINRWVEKLSECLTATLGTETKQVGILSENRFEWPIAFFSILKSGNIAVPLDFNLSPTELSQFVKHSKTQLLFTTQKNIDKALMLCELCPLLEKIIVLDETSNIENNQSAKIIYAKFILDNSLSKKFDLKNNFRNVYSDNELRQMKDVAAIFYTSGTTGNPKGVCLTHENLISQIESTIDEVIKNDQPEVLVSVLPLFHVFEFTHGYLVPFVMGCTIHYIEDVSPENLRNVIKTSQATILLLVPLALERIKQGILKKVNQGPLLLKLLFNFFFIINGIMQGNVKVMVGKKLFHKIHAELGGKIKMIVSGGAALDTAVEKFFRILGFNVFQGYGLTECSPVLTTNRPDYYSFGTVGVPFKNIQIKINSEPGEKYGEVLAKGPNIMKGYYNNEIATKEAFDSEGWFKTGDIGEINPKGFLKILGRYKNVIVTANGENIYPEELESFFKSNKFIQDLIVFSGIEINQKENLSAIIIPNIENLAKEKEYLFPEQRNDIQNYVSSITEVLNKTLSPAKRIQKIYYSYEDFLRTSTKKIKRKETIQQYFKNIRYKTQKEDLIQKTSVNIDKKYITYLKDQFRSYNIPLQKVYNFQSSFESLGVDSLLKVEIIKNAFDYFKKSFNPSVYAEINTTGELIKKLESVEEKINNDDLDRTDDFSRYDIYLNKKFITVILAGIFGLVLKIFFKTYFRLKIHDPKNLLRKLNNGILIANHVSHLDTMSIYMSLPMKVRANTYVVAAKDYFFDNPFKTWFFGKLLNSLPMDRKSNQYESLALAKYVLSKGKNLIIFPEGTRSTTGELLKFKPGIGQLLLDTNKKITGLYFPDSFKLFPKGALFPRSGMIRVNVLDIDLDTSSYQETDYKNVQEITALLEQQYRLLELAKAE